MFRRGNFRSTFYNERKKITTKVKNLREISSAYPRDHQKAKNPEKWESRNEQETKIRNYFGVKDNILPARRAGMVAVKRLWYFPDLVLSLIFPLMALFCVKNLPHFFAKYRIRIWLKSDWIVSTFNISEENSEIRTKVGSQPHCYSPYQVKRHYMWKHYRGPTEKTKQFPSSTENRGHHLWKQQRRLFQRGRGCRPEKARLHQPWERFIIGSHKCRREKTVFNHFGRPIWWFHEKIHHQPRSRRWWWRQSIPELQKVGPNQNFVQIWPIFGRAATGDR